MASKKFKISEENQQKMREGIANNEEFQRLYPGVEFEDYLNILKDSTSIVGINKHKMKEELEKLSKQRNKEQLVENVQKASDPEQIKADYEEITNVVEPLVQKERLQSDVEREQFRGEAEGDVTKELPGLTDKQRRSLQESANSQINKQVQNYKRMLASTSGRRGIRGGAAAAPQLEVARQGLDAQNQFQRDLVEKDSDLAMRRLAAYLSNIEGRSAEQLLRRGQLFDYVTGRQQQGLQSAYKKYYENLFGAVK